MRHLDNKKEAFFIINVQFTMYHEREICEGKIMSFKNFH